MRFLEKTGRIVVDDKAVRLTPTGRDAQKTARRLHGELERAWERTYGADTVQRLRAGLDGVLEQRDGARQRLSLGLQPPPNGWRATRRYAAQTNAVIADPAGRLPHYPMVLHRGGWPDGS